jgi:hypothetical protein
MTERAGRIARSGQIRSKAYAKKAGFRPKGPKKTAGGGPGKSKKKATPEITGRSRVQKYGNFISLDKNGGMVIDEQALAAAKAAAPLRKAKAKGANLKSAPAAEGSNWETAQFEDPALVEERNRMANMANNPQLPQQQTQMPQQQGPQGMYGQYQQMFGLSPSPNAGGAFPDYGMYGPGGGTHGAPPGAYPGYGDYPMGPGGPSVVAQPVQKESWRKPPSGGVLLPHEVPGAPNRGASAPSPQQSGDLMAIIGQLKTEEMIALACGGAGFLLFIVVIVVVIIRFKKKRQKKNKKAQDAARNEWRATSDTLSPPPGYQPSYSAKDPEHLARIQGRELPPPPALSYTQSAGPPLTGMTTASGTYMSDERPSMRHKD